MKNFIKDYFKKSIKKIAEENSKTFGSGKLDCCGLNSSNNESKKVKDKNK